MGIVNNSKTVLACPKSNYVALNEASFKDVAIYDNNGGFKQYLDYIMAYALAVDCSEKLLAVIDSGAYISYVSYNGDGSAFPDWAIGLIVGIVAVIICAAVIGAVCCGKKRMQRMDGYGHMNNQAPFSQNNFPNQPQGYNQNPFNQNQNQGFNQNQNQGFNQNQNQGFNPNQQVNQPRNWN